MRHPRRAVFLGAAAALALIAPAAAPAAKPAANPKPLSKHDKVVAFWTNRRVAQAVPRDAVVTPQTPPASPPDRPKEKDPVRGASWTGGGLVARTTGKVLFELAGGYWLCSGGVVQDGVSGRSFVLTAAHCAVDETTAAFATNWMFVPDYDSEPAPLTDDGSFCASTAWGCWTADALVVRGEYANAGAYNPTAIRHDTAVAVVGLGGEDGDSELDATVGYQGISVAAQTLGATTHAFGYPVTRRNDGADLTYCKGPLETDPLSADLNYRLARCDMAGGSSGGPWIVGLDATGSGTVVSVSTFGYNSVKAMQGPIFGAWTQSLLTAAATATNDTVVS